MDEKNADEIADEYRKLDQGDPDTDAPGLNIRRDTVHGALAELIPDAVAWAVLPGDAFPRVYVLAGEGLYTMDGDHGEAGFGLGVTRHDLTEASLAVAERLDFDHGTTHRMRRWIVQLPGGDSLTLDSEEHLKGSTGPDRVEQLARAIARVAGWGT